MSVLTENQKEVVEEFREGPKRRDDIADSLGITSRAVRYRMDSLEEKGYTFESDDNWVWHMVDEPDGSEKEVDNADPWRIDSYNKAQMTKEVNNQLTKIEKEVKEALSSIEPVKREFEREIGSSTLVIPHSDSHIGSIVDERCDIDYYSTEEAKDNIKEYFRECIKGAKRRGDVEDVALILNGDHLDGEGVFATQRHEQEDNLRDQLRKAGRLYIEEIMKLADEFDFVHIYCVPGNHGQISKRSTTNADMMLFDFIETGISYSEYENIHIEKAGPGGFKNFSIRGWDYHARHGEGLLEHAGTSSGKNRVKDHYMQYDGYDVLLRSHYHMVKIETIGHNIPITMTGSTAPQSTFAEERGSGGGECGMYWFATNDSRLEGMEFVRVNS